MFLLTDMDLVVFAPSQEHITPERTFAAGGYIKKIANANGVNLSVKRFAVCAQRAL